MQRAVVRNVVIAASLICFFAGTVLAETIDFSGRIDGGDSIHVTPALAVWTHTQFSPPGTVLFDGLAWQPQVQSSLSAQGTPFIPSDLTDYRVNVVKTAGRDQVAAEISGNDVIVHIDDTPNGDDQYAFQVVLTPQTHKVPTAQTLLHVQGTIDGSDRVVIRDTGATLQHFFWDLPTFTLNGVPWNAAAQSTMPNSGATQFLPNAVDFSTATFVKNSGRDLASFEVFDDRVELIFADNPLGAGNYDVTLSFSSPVPEPTSLALAVAGCLGSVGLCRYRRRRAG
jgi:hypothetical protein